MKRLPAVALALLHAFVLGVAVAPAQTDGSILSWGTRVVVERTVLENLVAIAAGRSHSMALKSDGTIIAWGDNSYTQCKVPTPNGDFVAVAGGTRHSLGLKS